MAVTVTIEGPKAPPPLAGLTDGGHVVPRCSACDRPLCDIHVTQPNAKDRRGEPFRWRVRATCGYGCVRADGSPETSFVQEFTGLYHLGAYGVDSPDDPDDSDVRVAVVDTRFEDDGVLTIVTRKKVK